MVLGFHHNSHSQRYHVDIDLLVPHQVHLEEVVRLGLPKLLLVYHIQLLQKNQLQLLYLLVYIVNELVLVVCLFALLTGFVGEDRLLEIGKQIAVDLFDLPLLDVCNQFLYLV